MVGTHPAATGWVPEVGGSEPPTEGIHKDGDGPDQASDRVQHLAHLPGRSPILANLDVTALGLGHGPHLLPGSSPPRPRTASDPGGGAGEGPPSLWHGPRGRRHDPDAAAGVIGVGADGVGREAEAVGDVRDGEAVDGRERWRRSRRTQLMVLMIKELTQQAQATTASKRSTRGVAQAMAIVKAPPSPSPRPTALTTTSSSTTTPPSAPRTWCPGPGRRSSPFPPRPCRRPSPPSAPSPHPWAFFTAWRSCPPPPGENDERGRPDRRHRGRRRPEGHPSGRARAPRRWNPARPQDRPQLGAARLGAAPVRRPMTGGAHDLRHGLAASTPVGLLAVAS